MSMTSLLRSFWGAKRQPRPAGPRVNSRNFRPALEGLEDRCVMSAATLTPPQAAFGPAVVGPLAPHAPHPASVLPLHFTGVTVQNGQLVAHGLLGVNPFTAPLTVTASPGSTSPSAAADPSTPILNLHLGPIDLNLLGLEVKTSEICLSITANSGPGNLLGNLLTDVAGLLNSGSSLGNILGGLTGARTSTLTNGLTSLLNRVAGRLTSPTAVGTPAAPTATTTNILHLSLGPLNLNLLGLEVNLDDCHNGPVTVDINAISGPGNLLGNLLTGVAHLLDNPLGTAAVDRLLTRAADDLLMLL
jgi:hypothetical protein